MARPHIPLLSGISFSILKNPFSPHVVHQEFFNSQYLVPSRFKKIFGAVTDYSITNGCNTVIKVSATRSSHDATGVELECFVTAIYRH